MSASRLISLVLLLLILALAAGVFWRSKTRPSGSLPAWAEFFTPNEYTEFMRLVRTQFADQAATFDEDMGAVCVQPPGREQRTFGLENIAKTCRQAGRSEWEALVSRHFQLTRAEGSGSELCRQGYAAVRDRLTVRLFAKPDVPGNLVPTIFCREDLPDILTVLMLDTPEMMESVRREDAAGWGVPETELFTRALRNTAVQYPPQENKPEPGTARIYIYEEGSYGSATALSLASHTAAVGRHGSLVAVPVRQLCLALPLDDVHDLTFMPGLAAAAERACKEGPYSISPAIYWHRGADGFVRLSCRFADGKLEFTPPAEFLRQFENDVQQQSQSAPADRNPN